MAIHEVPVHDVKTSVWCAMIATRISASTFSVRPKTHADRLQTFWKQFLTYPIMTELALFQETVRILTQKAIQYVADRST
jgi:hypothetical protein